MEWDGETWSIKETGTRKATGVFGVGDRTWIYGAGGAILSLKK